MIFVFGGAFSGKSDYVREELGIERIDEYDVKNLAECSAIRDFHLRVREVLRGGGDVTEEINRLLLLNPDMVIISNEIGYGIVPTDAFERQYREAVGRAHCLLVKRAEIAVRVVCGIGVSKVIALIRHGITEGNKCGRYIGVTDESLCDTGCLKRSYPKAELVVTSPMKRCVETADFIYPEVERLVVDDLRECDFGVFENKCYNDLKNNAAYKRWIASMCKMPFPGGEANNDFRKRCVAGFRQTINAFPEKDIAFVVHGGTIMSIMSDIFDGYFFDFQVKNGGGYVIDLKNKRIISEL